MAASINSSPISRGRDLGGQTVVVIGGSSGIGLGTAGLARAHGADLILIARDPDRLHRTGPADIAALAVHLMTNTAITGATIEVDGGQHLIDE